MTMVLDKDLLFKFFSPSPKPGQAYFSVPSLYADYADERRKQGTFRIGPKKISSVS